MESTVGSSIRREFTVKVNRTLVLESTRLVYYCSFELLGREIKAKEEGSGHGGMQVKVLGLLRQFAIWLFLQGISRDVS